MPLDVDPEVVKWLELYAIVENEPTYHKVLREREIAKRSQPRDSDDYVIAVEGTRLDRPEYAAIRERIRNNA